MLTPEAAADHPADEGQVAEAPASATARAAGRLDLTLVDLGLAATRSRAADLVRSGAVDVDGQVVRRPGYAVRQGATLSAVPFRWVGRGAVKLVAGLDAFGIRVADRRCLDIGASTGGFTQVLLDRGAARVIALDVGHDQLAQTLRDDPRVVNLEGVNVRDATLDLIGHLVDVVVIDVSFIGLHHVFPVAASLTNPGADLIALIKPQFEVGRAGLDRQGVVREPAARIAAVERVIASAGAHDLHTRAVITSPVTGAAGNVEYLCHLVRSEGSTMGTSPHGVDLLHLEPGLRGER